MFIDTQMQKKCFCDISLYWYNWKTSWLEHSDTWVLQKVPWEMEKQLRRFMEPAGFFDVQDGEPVGKTVRLSIGPKSPPPINSTSLRGSGS